MALAAQKRKRAQEDAEREIDELIKKRALAKQKSKEAAAQRIISKVNEVIISSAWKGERRTPLREYNSKILPILKKEKYIILASVEQIDTLNKKIQFDLPKMIGALAEKIENLDQPKHVFDTGNKSLPEILERLLNIFSEIDSNHTIAERKLASFIKKNSKLFDRLDILAEAVEPRLAQVDDLYQKRIREFAASTKSDFVDPIIRLTHLRAALSATIPEINWGIENASDAELMLLVKSARQGVTARQFFSSQPVFEGELKKPHDEQKALNFEVNRWREVFPMKVQIEKFSNDLKKAIAELSELGLDPHQISLGTQLERAPMIAPPPTSLLARQVKYLTGRTGQRAKEEFKRILSKYAEKGKDNANFYFLATANSVALRPVGQKFSITFKLNLPLIINLLNQDGFDVEYKENESNAGRMLVSW